MAPQRRLSLRTKDSIIRRNIRKVDEFEDGDRDDAVAAARMAAKNAVETVFVEPSRNTQIFGSDLMELHSLYSPTGNRNINIDDSSVTESQSSLLSRERALFRGSTRGLFEENENRGNGSQIGGLGLGTSGGSFDGFSLDRGDLTTIEEARQSTVNSTRSKKSTKKKPRERLSSFLKTPGLKTATKNESSTEVWMCGVCSKSFSSYNAAKQHEDYHIKEIVMDLGWLCNTPTIRSDNSNTIDNGGIQQQYSSLQFHPPPPSMAFNGSTSNGLKPPPMRFEPLNEFDDFLNCDNSCLPDGFTVLADEALVDVCSRAEALILSQVEKEAEFELKMCSRDRDYYNMLELRDIERRQEGAYSRFRTDGKNFAQKVQNKMVDAYAIMKAGKEKKRNLVVDYYTRKYKGDLNVQTEIENTSRTLYVNVIVKNSIKVVSHELERLAKQRWEEYKATHDEKFDGRSADTRAQFEKFKALAQGNLVKLAGYALASDFTPRRIAVQLSNDLFRLIAPRLKRRGVFIETEIEYRVGAYFVLACNVLRVDWRRLVKMTNRDVAERRARWQKESMAEDEKEGHKRRYGPFVSFLRLLRMTRIELLAQFLALLYHTHWIIYTPICFVLYNVFIGDLFRTYFLTSVTDEIFYYVEQKGMEMDVVIRDSQHQAAFMISALKEIRADGRELKKKKEGEMAESGAELLGPLLGPMIKEDTGPAPPIPEGFEVPENLEFVGLELSLTVGFRRLRWAILNKDSKFITEAVYRVESNYANIEVKPWNKFDAHIGLPKLPENVNENEFLNAEKECQYLMPKSAFVSANMCYETSYIEAYNDYCFSVKKKALTPGVPYGGTFEAWTKYVFINTGNNTCKMICSVEPVFPNGQPMIAGQIRSGMRSGVGALFVKTGETIDKYKDEVP